MCKALLFVSSGIIVMSLAMAGAGLWLDYWYVQDKTYSSVTTTYRGGLWNRCYKTTSETCERYAEVNSTLFPYSLTAVKIMCCVGGATIGLAVICLILKCMLLEGQKRSFSIISATVSVLGGLTLIAGSIVYGVQTRNEIGFDISHLHAGFALIVVSGVLAVVGGIFLCVSKERIVKEEED